MGTFTAQILVGQGHPNHGGIVPSHQLFLSENSRPAWLLTEMGNGRSRTVWIPTVEHMLEDGLCLIAAVILKDAAIRRHVPDGTSRVECYDIPATDRNAMYRRIRELDSTQKIAVSILGGSSIASQVRVLKEMPFDLELCLPQFRREFSNWSQRTECEGSL